VLLDRQLPGQVWETTHVGGDRFAPNVVTLPEGTYHGGVSLTDVPALARAVTAGQVLRPRLRGRAGLPFAVQAADHFLRDHLALDVVDALRPVASSAAPAGPVCVELVAEGSRWCVHVRTRECQEVRLTSCAGEGTLGRPSSFELVSLARLG
jgi:hypothetical protein